MKITNNLPVEIRHIDDMPWETLRFPGQHSKMLFHPRPDRPTEPNTGFVRYEAGANHPLHCHDFAQVWYVLEGTFKIGERVVGPGSMLHYPDPHFEEALSTDTGGLMLFVQRPLASGVPQPTAIGDALVKVAVMAPAKDWPLRVIRLKQPTTRVRDFARGNVVAISLLILFGRL